AFGPADPLGLEDFESVTKRGFLDGRHGNLIAASFGSVRLGHHQFDLMAGSDQSFERGDGELGSAQEDEAHGSANGYSHSPAFISFLTLRLMRSRLRLLMWEIKRMPCRWSISCCMARASRSSPSLSNHSPSTFCARIVTFFARDTCSRNPGMLRQPSSPTCLPS